MSSFRQIETRVAWRKTVLHLIRNSPGSERERKVSFNVEVQRKGKIDETNKRVVTLRLCHYAFFSASSSYALSPTCSIEVPLGELDPC